MKSITKYEANDGSQWNTADKAIERDSLLIVLDEASRLLKPHPSDCNFEGYIQQNRESVLDYKRILMRIAKKYAYGTIGKEGEERCIWDMDPKEVHPLSIAGRFIDDSNCQPLNSAWRRLCCMDDKFREFNQPFYVINPDKAVIKEIK